MSLINSMFAGVSGLRNHQSMMDVIGNNIANVNSIGFKGSRVTFADTFNQFVKAGTNPSLNSGGTNSFQVGLGMKVNSIDRNWNQGTFERTGIVTDLALQGSGLFILKSDNQTYYSRAGAFIFDAEGNLVNPNNGAIVQGKIATALGEIPSGNSVQDIKINSNERLSAIATTEAVWGGNLSSSAAVTRTEEVVQTGNINSGDAGPFNFTSTIYDEDGNSYTLTTTYTKTANPNEYTLTWDISDSTGSIATGNIGAAGDIDFEDPDADGVFTLTAASQAILDAANITVGANNINLNLNASALTQNASTSTVSSVADGDRTPTLVTGTITIFDSLGESHSLTVQFTKTANNNWNWSASVPSESGTLDGGTGTISFNADGSINTISPNPPVISFDPVGGAVQDQLIELDFGADLSGIVQTSSTSSISARSQDGSASATLANLNIDQYGNIVGVFTNGYSKTLAQIMVATFSNLNGLVSVGDNMYAVSANSGDPYVANLGEATATTLQSGTLEQSNVDLSEEFTKMIVSQRGFQANARVITTADTLLQEVTNLVR